MIGDLLGALGYDHHDGFAAFETGAHEGQDTRTEILVGVVHGSGVKGAGVRGTEVIGRAPARAIPLRPFSFAHPLNSRP